LIFSLGGCCRLATGMLEEPAQLVKPITHTELLSTIVAACNTALL